MNSRFILVLAGIFLAVQTEVFACSCAKVLTLQEGIERSAEVFQGEVERVEIAHDKKVTFKVKKIWKGQKEATKHVFTPAQGLACGVSFNERREYLVFASPDSGGNLYTTSCSATIDMEWAVKNELEAIGPGSDIA